jgi:hypothetical protein
MSWLQFKNGDLVQKSRGSKWRGKIVGVYSASLTDEGYAVESFYEPGNVQIYPAIALEHWAGPPDVIGALERTIKYLDTLDGNLMRNDVDMLLDECEPPAGVAGDLRAIIAQIKGDAT